MPARSWPSSPLDAADRAWKLLITPPTQLRFDGHDYPGLPDRVLPLDELRAVLLAAGTPFDVRDVVWRELVHRARHDGPAWVVAAVGMALPGLRRIAGRVAAGWRGDTDDLDAELLAGFLDRLKTIDLDGSRILGRLLDAALRAGRRRRDADADTHLVHLQVPEPTAPIAPWDHPDLVLARAVAAAVIDRDEAHLIGATRLGTATLAEAGAELGITASRAADWRRAAERRLVDAIIAGELAFVLLRQRRPHADGTDSQPDSAVGGAAGRRSSTVGGVGQRRSAVDDAAGRQPGGGDQRRGPVGRLLGRADRRGSMSATNSGPSVGTTSMRPDAPATPPDLTQPVSALRESGPGRADGPCSPPDP